MKLKINYNFKGGASNKKNSNNKKKNEDKSESSNSTSSSIYDRLNQEILKNKQSKESQNNKNKKSPSLSTSSTSEKIVEPKSDFKNDMKKENEDKLKSSNSTPSASKKVKAKPKLNLKNKKFDQKQQDTSKIVSTESNEDNSSTTSSTSTSRQNKFNISANSISNNFQGIFNRVTNGDHKTASYIFTRDKDGVFYFALSRKVPSNARIRITGDPTPNTGSAGTLPKYHGKWGNFGGTIGSKSVKNKHSRLRAAINEINDEGDINPNIDSLNNVSINGIPNKRLTLRYFKDRGNIFIFLFEMPFQQFFNLFPRYPDLRGGADIVARSKGEIDYVTSMNMRQIIHEQNETINKLENDFILPYCIDTFNSDIIPAIGEISEEFKKRNYNIVKYFNEQIKGSDLPLPDPYNKIYQENPVRKGALPTYTEIR